ncbi:hypothetical protein [Streptomyces sp. NBC_00083]|uniref:hypothetical protein n=1 Tax=Streptomyces sp. NBC_00083 TaxID=2975647 RepID=UPI00224DCE8B|nr:hypothetical protein [Streptomyces sp. NBC_00083]MCX5384496.1 hypothetical protein [Streptomyces sp. NBC_00083]
MITSVSVPLLRPDVFLTPSGSGTVYVRSSRGTDLIAAPGIAGWLERLAPFLDGSRTVAQLLDGLDGARRGTVLRVLQLLDEHGLLDDVAPREPDPRAARYPHLRTLALGTPAATGALADALRLTGLTGITPVAGQEAALTALANGGHDALLLLAEGGDARSVARLDEECRVRGLWFAAAVRDAESWWIGPMLAPGPDRTAGGWLGAWLRVHGREDAPVRPPHVSYGSTEFAAPLLAHHFQRAFLSLSPAAPEEPGTSGADQPVRVTRLDATTLATTSHPYRPHPAALPAAPESAAQFLARIASLRAGPAVTPEEFSRRAAGCIDERCGLLAELDEGALPQFPRHAARALVRDPDTGRAVHQVHATGTDFTAARLRTARRALAHYALLALDPRRFVPAPSGPALWAWSPERDTAHLVPAARVRAQGTRPPRGLGAGATFDEAVAEARRDLRGPAHDTVVVPLDHDPAATDILPNLLRAVRCDD